MTYSTTKMNSEDQMGWPGFAAIFSVVFGAVSVCIVWINKAFEARKNEKAAFIRAVVMEAMEGGLKELKHDIREIKENQREDKQELNTRIDEVIRGIAR